MAVVFDTLKQHQSLVEAGFSGTQAQALTNMATAILGVVATKSDLARLETKFDGRFEAIDKRFEDLNKTLDRMNSLMIGQISATVGGIGIMVGSIFAVIAPHLR